MTLIQDIDTGNVTVVDPLGNQTNQPVSVTERLANPCIVNVQFSKNGTIIGLNTVTVISASVANPTVITTNVAHNLTTGQTVQLFNFIGGTPILNGSYTITVTGATTFTIPVNVTVIPTTAGSVQLTSAATINFTVKASYSDVSPAAQTTAFTLKAGTYSTTSIYTAELNLSTTACYALFNSPHQNDASSILISAVDWTQLTDAGPQEGQTMTFFLQNRVEGAGSPTPAPGAAITYANSLGLLILLPGITAYTGGASNALDSIPTTTLIVPWNAVMMSSTDGRKEYELVAGTTATSSPSVIRPQDYNGSTNQKVWISVG